VVTIGFHDPVEQAGLTEARLNQNHLKRHPRTVPVFLLQLDCNEREHVHVQRENKVCKYWLTPLALGSSDGFSARELNQIRTQVALNMKRFWRLGMSIAANAEARIQTVSVTEDTISPQLMDGRTISVPLAWSWRLSEATPEQRARFEIMGSGSGIRWAGD